MLLLLLQTGLRRGPHFQKTMSCEVEPPQCKSLLCLWLAVCRWATSFGFSVLIRKKVIVHTYGMAERLGNNGYQGLNAVPDTQPVIILSLVPSTPFPRLLGPFFDI